MKVAGVDVKDIYEHRIDSKEDITNIKRHKKPVFTIEVIIDSLSPETEHKVPHNISGFDEIWLDFSASYVHDIGKGVRYGINHGLIKLDPSKIAWWSGVSDTDVILKTNGLEGSTYKAKMVIQYTKK